MEEMSRRSLLELEALMKKKLLAAGLPEAAASETAAHLTFADACGIHSHGAVRMDYYAERLVKGGITLEPNMSFEKTSAATGIFHGDNGMGHYVCNEAMAIAIHLAKEAGIAAVGIEQTSHSGTMAYYVKQAAEADLVAIAMCQSDPMAVPFGGTENYFGTNPIAFAAPRANHPPVVFDMATTVQAWGQNFGRSFEETADPRYLGRRRARLAYHRSLCSPRIIAHRRC
ncbi:ureidoglycolate dehydrogenase [Enterococcus casseliflavus]|nr:ureidoglycolate dehydrogenase [Enterococcus casseliflavus]